MPLWIIFNIVCISMDTTSNASEARTLTPNIAFQTACVWKIHWYNDVLLAAVSTAELQKRRNSQFNWRYCNPYLALPFWCTYVYIRVFQIWFFSTMDTLNVRIIETNAASSVTSSLAPYRWNALSPSLISENDAEGMIHSLALQLDWCEWSLPWLSRYVRNIA